jgi:hypothetical protein
MFRVVPPGAQTTVSTASGISHTAAATCIALDTSLECGQML